MLKTVCMYQLPHWYLLEIGPELLDKVPITDTCSVVASLLVLVYSKPRLAAHSSGQ